MLALAVGFATPGVARAQSAGFPLGVSVGEVTPTSAMFWTRSSKSGPVVLLVSRNAGRVGCSIPSGARALTGVRRRIVLATARSDYTVRTTLAGLRPATRYFYRFCARSGSPLGQFETAPPTNADVPIRFALTGDADGAINPATGAPAYNRFEVYRRMAAAANDFNVNVGDVMYSDSAVAGVPPALTVDEKWAKYRLNLTYANLRVLRSRAALYSHWDDHEFTDNFNRPQFGEELFAAGAKAFLDYNPVRFQPATGLYRSFRWGRNAELFFLDVRAFRGAPASLNPACTNAVTGLPDFLPLLPQRLRETLGPQIGLSPQAAAVLSPDCKAAIEDPARPMLGAAQLRAFENAISRSRATFKIVVNPVPIQEIYWDPFDRWEGYAAERRSLLAFLRTRVRNLVFLSTDFHANMINNVRLSTFGEGGPSIDTGFVEFVTGPVALKTFAADTDQKTGFPGAAGAVRRFLKAPRPLGIAMRCAALDAYGYAQVHVTSKAITIALRDAQGRPVRETPSGPSCPPVTLPRR